MINPYKSKSIINLKKVKGQVERILKMIEEDKYCIDIAQQINSGIGILKKTNEYVLESHLITCGTKKISQKNKEKQVKFIQELVRTFSIINR